MSATTRRQRVLLLDGDADRSGILAIALEAQGLEVHAEADGVRGVTALLDELMELDALVVDVDLPGRDALALVHLVRRAGGEQDLAIAVLATGRDAARDAQHLAMGADVVLDRAGGEGAAAAAIAELARVGRPERPAPDRALQPEGALLATAPVDVLRLALTRPVPASARACGGDRRHPAIRGPRPVESATALRVA